MTSLPVGELIRLRKPCARFCLRLLFCAVVSDIVTAPSLWILRTGGYYKLKRNNVKQKTMWKQGFDFVRHFWYIAANKQSRL
jgi:hypothetical protein